MPQTERLTPREAGLVLGWHVRAINKAIDTGVIPKKDLGEAKGKLLRLLKRRQLRFMALAQEFEKDLNPKGRKRFYAAIMKTPDTVHVVEVGNLRVDISLIDKRIVDGLNRLDALKSGIEERDGDAFFSGTDISVYMVAALARGQSTEEICQDFPSLTHTQVESAVRYAMALPKVGRPYPARSMKRALGDLIAAGVFDEAPVGAGA